MQFVNELIRGADAADIGCFGNRDVQRLVHLRRRRAGASERQQCQNKKFYLHLSPPHPDPLAPACYQLGIGTSSGRWTGRPQASAAGSEEPTTELQTRMRLSHAV